MKRLLATLALAALLASPAAAQTDRFVGTWLVGTAYDDLRVLRLSIRDDHNVGWGTAIGKDYVPYLELSKTNGTTCYAMVEGAWEDTSESVALFALGQCPTLAPTTGYQEYLAILVIRKAGLNANLAADTQRKPFRFRIERWP
jgi:hypothetical protein